MKKGINNQATTLKGPYIAQKSHLETNNETQGAKGKIEFEHFIKLL
jgi:hypothetical protein